MEITWLLFAPLVSLEHAALVWRPVAAGETGHERFYPGEVSFFIARGVLELDCCYSDGIHDMLKLFESLL